MGKTIACFGIINRISYRLTYCLILVFVVGFFLPAHVHAQVFESKVSADTLKVIPVRQKPADFNNDAYMDIMAHVEIAPGNEGIALIFNNGTFDFDTVKVVLDSLQVNAFMTLDYDRDNDIDIFSRVNIGVDTTYFITYLNQPNGSFKSDTIALIPSFVNKTGFGDFDNNGSREIVMVEDSTRLGLYLAETQEIQPLPAPPNNQLITDFYIADFNNDSWTDIFISTVVNDSVSESGIIYNLDSLNFSYEPLFKFRVEPGGITLADIDHNGFDDLLLHGTDPTGRRSSQVMINRGDTLFLEEIILPELDNAEYFIADFTSDGLVDISITGDHEDGASRHYLLIMDQGPGSPYFVSNIDTLRLDTLGYQRIIADYDVDGDLDLSLWNRFNGKLEVFENITPEVNQGPELLLKPVAFFGENEIVVVWGLPNDDHTAAEGITYDFSFYKTPKDQLIGTGFDVKTLDRMIPAYGYYGHNQVAFIRDPGPGDYFFHIQPIDNALFVKPKGVGGGGGYGSGISFCQDSNVEEIYVCDDGPIQLNLKEAEDPGPPAWYSYNQGYLDFHDVLTYQPKDSFDIVYAGIPEAIGCLNYKTFFIHKVEVEPPQITADTTICTDSELALQIKEEYDSVAWYNASGERLSSSAQLIYLSPNNVGDTLIYEVFKARCLFTDSIFIEISEPDVRVERDSLKITAGNVVDLNASGTLSYRWAPTTWLDNPDIPNPLASPEETITYEVFGWDIFGCEDTATVFIEVTNLAFAPNLFTPNNDGKNENFKILNLGSPSGFELKVFDRNGKALYETSVPGEAAGVGWDGTFNGNPVPEGVYFWKVTGNYPDGKPVLVNGKTDGVVHLMR